QDDLFGELLPPAPAAPARKAAARDDVDRDDDGVDDDDDKSDAVAAPKRRRAGIQAQPADEAQVALAAALSPRIRLGTSSWSYPGWQGIVWAGRHGES